MIFYVLVFMGTFEVRDVSEKHLAAPNETVLNVSQSPSETYLFSVSLSFLLN